MDPNEQSLYRSLEQSERQFRLLRLLDLEPGSHRIRCEMESFSLLIDYLPPWKALSYRWGDEEPQFIVYVNDHPVTVRKGLQTFLAQMVTEKQHAPEWYFIDALCIDQDNDEERSHQVQQMAEIYRRAEEVVVWIMDEPFEVEVGNEFIPHFEYLNEDARNVSSYSHTELEVAILTNSYWSRLWILQEVLLAEKLTFRIGNAKLVCLDPLAEDSRVHHIGLPNTAASLWPSSVQPLHNRNSALTILRYRHINTKFLRARKHLPFHEAADCFSMQCCTRPHDKVFAYLGLTNSRIRVDYSTPVLDLFVATLADYLLSAGFLKEKLTPLRLFQLPPGLKFTSPPAPLLAFKLDPCEPVVQLLIREVFNFFAPGGYVFGSFFASSFTLFSLKNDVIISRQDLLALLGKTHLFAPKRILFTCLGMVKIAPTVLSKVWRTLSEMDAQQGALKEEDAVMPAPGEDNRPKRYSEWVAQAKAICEQMWQRFEESNEDAEDVMNEQ